MDANLLEKIARIVAAYVSGNQIPADELPALIHKTHGAFSALSAALPEQPVENLKPAVPIRKSVTPEFIICLDDGMRFKSMKRHLASIGMTPEEYRAKWGLPADYPMVAPNYAATRSALAKSNGLGRKPGEKPPQPSKRTKRPKPEE